MLGRAELLQLEDAEGNPGLYTQLFSVSMKSIRTTMCSYRVLFSGEKSASRPTASLLCTSLSGFSFLKSDGRFRI